MSGEILGCQHKGRGGGGVCRGTTGIQWVEAEMLLAFQSAQDGPPRQTMSQSQTSIVLRMRNWSHIP